MKSLFPFCLFILFSLTISFDAVVQLTRAIGHEQAILIAEQDKDTSKSEDPEKENFEVGDDLFYYHHIKLEFQNPFARQISTLECINKNHFLSHSYVEEIYSPPDLVSII